MVPQVWSENGGCRALLRRDRVDSRLAPAAFRRTRFRLRVPTRRAPIAAPALLAVVGIALATAGCDLFFPPALSVRVRPSELLGEYADRPLWQWRVDGAGSIGRLQVSLNHGRFRELPPAARSYRAPVPLAPGRHVLTVRARVGDRTLQASASARVAALPALPGGIPDDARERWWLEQIRLPAVWQAYAGGGLPPPRPVIVAVLDGGYLPHPDLAGGLDPAAGYDFVSAGLLTDGDGVDPDAYAEGAWHGTAVAGIVAAGTGNGYVAGMDWSAAGIITVMPVRVIDVDGIGTDYDLAQGVRYAAGLANDSGELPPRAAKIINVSVSDPEQVAVSAVLQSAFYRATRVGAIVVAAAGNEAPAKVAVRAPASSGCTLAVGATRADRELASYSNHGPRLDLVAPGGEGRAALEVLATAPDGSWSTLRQQGTSFAAPHLSGALALLASWAPDLTLEDAGALLADSAADLGSAGWDDRYGAGLLDVFALLGAYPPRDAVTVPRRPCRPPALSAVVRAADAKSLEAAMPPPDADPGTLVLRWSGGPLSRAEGAAAVAALSGRLGLLQVSPGDGEFSLVRLREDQDLRELKARLEADPAVAAVQFNRRFHAP